MAEVMHALKHHLISINLIENYGVVARESSVNLCPDVHPLAAMSCANPINITIVNSAGTLVTKDIKSIW